MNIIYSENNFIYIVWNKEMKETKERWKKRIDLREN